MAKYIYQDRKFPGFFWDKAKILNTLTRVAALQGRILGKMQQLGFDVQQETMPNALTEEITKSSEIEGEILNSEQVRSSLARQLNINLMVETMMDAVKGFNKPLAKSRLCGWHASLFPTGYSGAPFKRPCRQRFFKDSGRRTKYALCFEKFLKLFQLLTMQDICCTIEL